MSEASFQELNTFVDEYFQVLNLDFAFDEFRDSDSLVVALAKRIQVDFPFIEQGRGIATISKQIQDRQTATSDKQVLAKKSDCKLPTVMLAMICERLQVKFAITNVKIMTFTNGAYPHLLIQIEDGNAYLVYYRLKRPTDETQQATESVGKC